MGGPGELAYWATLKPAFTALDLQMPILHHFDIYTRDDATQKQLQHLALTVEQVFAGKHLRDKEAFIASVQATDALAIVTKAQQQLEAQYQQLVQHSAPSLTSIVQKNQQLHERQFAYLTRKIEQDVLQKHQTTLIKYDAIERELLPMGGLQ